MSMKTFEIIILSLSVFTLACCDIPGQKFLKMGIHQDGELVYSSKFDVKDSAGKDRIWEEAGLLPFSVRKELSIEDNNALKTTLEGKINITIKHVGRVETKVDLEKLELERQAGKGTHWYLPSGEVERIKSKLGL